MSVVGFDIGNENCVIGVVKDRGIDVLLNDESNRETPAVVSFGEKQRFMGSSGAASATMNPRSTVSHIKRLIGRKFIEPGIQDELKMLPFETCEGPDGSVLVKLQYLGETHTFSPVQILGMLLMHLKQMTEKNLGLPVSECVIGIPSYFTDLQRRAFLDAAAIAGLKPLRLMHDCTATALGYGIYKAESIGRKTTNVVFVDIGQCDTQVCVASLETGHMKILSHAFDSNLGGKDFDEVLFNHFALLFKDQYHIDVASSVKASIRLRASCEKLKKVLSANAEAPLNIECLMDEKDVKGFIKREEFEKLSWHLLERIKIPCQKALSDAGLTVGDIQSVELVGSGSRIPAISKMLSGLFQRELSRTVNASECVARGCALQGAMLSPLFRVREYEVEDSFPFSIGFSSDKGPIRMLSNSVLFPKGLSFPNLKSITLHRPHMFHLEAYYADQQEVPSCIVPKICTFMIGPFQTIQSSAAKIKVKVNLNLHGIVAIESAVLQEDQSNNHLKVRKANLFEKSEKESDQAPVDTTDDTDTTSSSLSGVGVSENEAVKRFDIPVSESVYGGMTKAELLEAEEKEFQLGQQDLKMEYTKNKKNALESYIYEMRDKILTTFRSFATDFEAERISSNLQELEEWLYEDGADESEEVYTGKLNYLHEIVDPVEKRYKDEEARPHEINGLLKSIFEYRKAAESLPADQRNMIIDECSKVEEWLKERIEHQESLPKNVNPVLWSSEINEKAHALHDICRELAGSLTKKLNPGDESYSGNQSDEMQVD